MDGEGAVAHSDGVVDVVGVEFGCDCYGGVAEKIGLVPVDLSTVIGGYDELVGSEVNGRGPVSCVVEFAVGPVCSFETRLLEGFVMIEDECVGGVVELGEAVELCEVDLSHVAGIEEADAWFLSVEYGGEVAVLDGDVAVVVFMFAGACVGTEYGGGQE